MKLINLTGKTFGRLTVLERFDMDSTNTQIRWKCVCVCGIIKVVRGEGLRGGKTVSCGCKKLEGNSFRSHSMSKTPEYKAWIALKYRCSEFCSDHALYFDRGIRVCDRWINSFENFFADMGKRPSKNHSVDRFPNNDTGIYEPTNCRWATTYQQAANTRRNRIIEYNGETKILSEWGRLFKADSALILAKLKRYPFKDIYNFYMCGGKLNGKNAFI